MPEQVGAEDFGKDHVPAEVDSEAAASGEDTAEGPDDGPEEASEKDDAAAGPWIETAPEVPCPAHSNPGMGRTMKKNNNPLTPQRFTRPPASRAASEHKLP